jgi:hypothetical protein
MTDRHPITPPPGLVQQWRAAASNVPASLSTDPGGRRDYIDFIATKAAQWGADQELEACLQWFSAFYCMETWMQRDLEKFRTARRPKPPSWRTPMADLSPAAQAAQAVLDAYDTSPFDDDLGDRVAIAAALRAAADQVVPEEPWHGGDQRLMYERDAHQSSRRKLLAIAAELDGANNTSEGL